MEDEMIDNELPSPPIESAAAEGIEDTIDASLFTDVPKMGDAMPVGTYLFRLDKFVEKWKTTDEKGVPYPPELVEAKKQPFFELHWKCQQEPHVGRVVFENCPWVRADDSRAANDPQNPLRGEAKSTINKRLPRAKEIMEAASFTPVGAFGFKQFLGSNPELKLQLKIKEKQTKGQDGKYHPSGDWTNEVQKHLSLHRPA